MLHVSEQLKPHEALQTSHNTIDGTGPKKPIPHTRRHLQHEPTPSEKHAKADEDRKWASQERLHRWTSVAVPGHAEVAARGRAACQTLQAILLSQSEWPTASAYQEPMCCYRMWPAFSPSCALSAQIIPHGTGKRLLRLRLITHTHTHLLL